MTTRILPVLALVVSAFALAGCSLVWKPIKEGTYVPFEHASVEVRVTEGELPDLGTFTLHDAGRYDGWGMDDGTNDSVDGSRAMFESDQGWQLSLERFGRDDADGDVTLRYAPTEGETTYAFSCSSTDLVADQERFSGTLDCSKVIPSKPPPLRIEITVEAVP